jgi:hypothetical protein
MLLYPDSYSNSCKYRTPLWGFSTWGPDLDFYFIPRTSSSTRKDFPSALGINCNRYNLEAEKIQSAKEDICGLDDLPEWKSFLRNWD